MSASTAAAGGDDGPDWTVRLTEAERRAVVRALEARIGPLQAISRDSDLSALAYGELREVRRVLAKVSE